MKYLITFLLIIFFVSFIVWAQPIRLQSDNGAMGLLGMPCGTPGICQTCIEMDVCNDGCDEFACAECVANYCNDIPIDGGLIMLLLAGFGLKIGHFIKSKRSGEKFKK